MAKDCHCSVGDLILDKKKREGIDIKRYVTDTVGLPTLTDIISELENRDATQENKLKNLNLTAAYNLLPTSRWVW